MFTKLLNKLKSGNAGSAAGAGVALAPEVRPVRHFGPDMLVVEGPRSAKLLIQVHTGAPPEFSREHIKNFYCLDMEEFGLGAAIDWVRRAHDVDPFGDNNRVPVIYVIGPNRPLNRQELRLVNDQLVPAGGYFFPRPGGATTFSAAMKVLRDELARQNGTAKEASAWRRPKAA